MKAVAKDAGPSALLDSLAPMLWHLPASERRGFTKRVSAPLTAGRITPQLDQRRCSAGTLQRLVAIAGPPVDAANSVSVPC